MNEKPCANCAATGRCLTCGGAGVIREWPLCARCRRIPTSEDHDEVCRAYHDAVKAWKDDNDSLLKAAQALYQPYGASAREMTPEERAANPLPVVDSK